MSPANRPPIVDAHVRLDRAGGERLSELAALAEQAGVVSVVGLTPTPHTGEVSSESSLIAAEARWVDLAADDVGDRLDELTASTKTIGVAVDISKEVDNHWLVGEAVLRGLRAAAERGMTLDVEVQPRQIPSIERLAEVVPDLKIAVAHIGSPFIDRSEREPWGVYMLNVAPHRNVHVKLSGLVTLDTRPWNVAHHRLFVESMLRLFGYERTMFGSDWPAHESVASYQDVIDAAIDAAGPMTSPQIEQLMAGTARAFYRLG